MYSNVTCSLGFKQLTMVFSLGALMVLVTTLQATAGTVTLFGPQQYIRAEGKPATFGTAFRVPPEVSNCRLVVKDGANGPASANNVSVKVNGVEMIDAKALRASDPAQVTVALQAENTLFVALKGKPGDQVTVEILGEVPDAPPRPEEPPVRPTPPTDEPPARPMPPTY